MPNVFLSYDHEDEARAAPLAAALEQHGHSVWWDRQIHGGAEYNSVIETAVEQSDAVVVLWSANSVRSAWVRDEAAEGRDRGRLVPVLIDAVKPPMGFRQYQTLDLSAWNGGKRIARLPDLLHAIDQVTRQPAAAAPAKPSPAPIRRSRPPADHGLSRRLALGGGAAAAVGLAAGGIWWSTREREDPRIAAIMDQAQDAVRHWSADPKTERSLEQLTAAQPANAKAWGYLALLRYLSAQEAKWAEYPALVEKAEKAAGRALSLDPKEPNALLAMFELQGSTLDWFERDQRLRQIVALDPKSLGALAELVLLTQATGMVRESWDWNERCVALDPLNLDYLCKRALKLWILGHPSEADKVIDQVRTLYPTDGWAWWVRFYLYAVTGRIPAARAMLNGNPTMNGRPLLAKMWRPSLSALEHPSPATVAAARSACLEGAKAVAEVASQAVQVLALIGDLDAAFDVADGLLLSRGSIVRPDQKAGAPADEAAWRIQTQWMFTRTTTAMRADPRFLPLCEGVGLTEYWRRRGVKPDYQRG